MARRKKTNKKKVFLTLFALSLLVGGLYLTTTTGFKLLHGYILFKTMPKEEVLASVPAPLKLAGENDAVELANNEEVLNWQPEIGEEMGVLTIPVLNTAFPLIHGTDDPELDRGVGHFSGSVLPGEADNSVLSGHNNTVFRNLGDVGEGDELIVQTKSGTYTYVVHTVRIVDEDDRTVIVSTDEAQLTVTTCYPFNELGFAPDRYVLVADLVDSQVNQLLAQFNE
ncbi:hypothetical protein JCM19045_1961 [Bacillus sp. JCM 19045]|nr:hypothetical protein JCM19045_1961 [Bacillus sp. JCM 19045]